MVGMLESFQFVKNIFWECSNDFQYMGLGIGAIIYLYMTIKENNWVRRWVCFSMLFFFLFAFPPFIEWSRYVLGDSKVYQLLWVLPFVFLIPYGAMVFGSKLRRRREKCFWISICVVLVLLAGDGVSERDFSARLVKENLHLVTDEQLQVCEVLAVAGESATVLGADLDLVKTIRKVNRYTKVIYGVDIEYADYDEEVVQLFSYMESDVIPVDLVLESAEMLGVNFFVWNRWKDYSMPIEELLGERLWLIGQTDNYWIFSSLPI